MFTGDQARAFQSIAAQTGVDPHSPLLTLAALSLSRKPDDILRRIGMPLSIS